MEPKPLSLLETRDALRAALSTLSSSGDYLNQLDQALGDGDHGSTIARGSAAAIRDLQARTFTTVNQEFEAIGSAMMNSMGGASGILFGVLFRAARNCPASETLDAPTLAAFLRRGLDDLKRKSPAAVGDKTMMDALVPAVEALEASYAEVDDVDGLFVGRAAWDQNLSCDSSRCLTNSATHPPPRFALNTNHIT